MAVRITRKSQSKPADLSLSRRARRSRSGIPIVGIGASAGGLEAFTLLLRKLPIDTGFGFVLVQHLDPLHESALTQLLARATAMPVIEATHNLRVKANHVYVIPPNTNLGITGGVLTLQPRARQRLALRSIDFFLEALARDQGERAIGVILSGTATDGTLGLEAIKAEGGLTFAQNDSARYDSMPRSAVAAGCVDSVLPPEGIARELARIARHPFVRRRAAGPATANGRERAAPREEPDEHGYQEILLQLRRHSGVDFALYKSSTILRRIKRRTLLARKESLAAYVDFLRGNPKELDALYSDVLINVTSFFRNEEVFAVLKTKVLKSLLQERTDAPLRVWVLGCSTGQEAYSLAMALTEVAEKSALIRRFQVFATDLSETNLERARHGLYAAGAVQDISPERLRRFFVEEEGGYRVIKPLREQVVFARHNLISDPPFSRMDLISCRNVMIYLESALQKRVLPIFHYALNPGGCLLLGASESVGQFTNLFGLVAKRQKIFRKKAAPAAIMPLATGKPRGELSSFGLRRVGHPVVSRKPEGWRGEVDPQREADRVTVAQFAPPSVLINADLQILQFRGTTSTYLEPPTGRAIFDLLKMARKGLMLPLRATIDQAKAEGRAVRKAQVPLVLEGRVLRVTIEVVPLNNLPERCYLVLFTSDASGDLARPEAPAALPPGGAEENARCRELERELAETRDYLHSIQEQQEVATGELQAANEEGESANEELQSLNEELETSKEELESTNEELTTVNEEVVSRNTELNRLNNDLTNLQVSTRLAVVLLGRDLTIRRFSPAAGKMFSLTAEDVGRPLRRVGHSLHLPETNTLIAGVIRGSGEFEREVRDKEGRWYLLRVRPYLTAEAEIEGAVLVLMDITELKKTEQLIREEHDHAEAIIHTVPNPLVLLNADLAIVSANDAFYRDFQLVPAQVKGRCLFDLDRGSWNIPRLRRMLEQIVPRRHSFDGFEVTHTFRRIGARSLLLNARTLNKSGSRAKEILLGMQDVSAQKRLADGLRDLQAKLARHAQHLEATVARRTRQLTEKNLQLQVSHASTSRSKEQYRALFMASQVMQRKLRQLTHQMLTAQEDERKEISRELHDQVVQTLVGIKIELAALSRSVARAGPDVQRRIARTQRLVEDAVLTVHRFARDLRPPVLDDLGLIPALHAFSQSLVARKRIKIHLTAQRKVEALSSVKRTVLFRVAQEALTNVLRHAHATRVQIHLRAVAGAVRLEIADNGRAFAVDQSLLAGRSKRLGLIGMRERVEMIGGSFTLHSKPGQGTTVCAEIPFSPSQPKL